MTQGSRLGEIGQRPPRMLIADDDPAIVQLLSMRCANAGFEVETATNGVHALIKANRKPPDVLIIDVNMPEADGLTVCARLLEPSRKSLNVIVVTGSREADTIDRCRGFGTFYVRKGPAFWSGLETALTETFPHMADRIGELHGRPTAAEMRERPRVLVIDDDPEIEAFLSSRLGKCGVEMLFASNVSEGFRLACRKAPSVIISDYFLPNGGIPYLLWRLRTLPETESIPVLVLTGRDLGAVTEQGLMREVQGKAGVARIFRKSLDTDELFGALQKLCGFEHNRVD